MVGTPEKGWSSSVGIIFPNIWKFIKHVPNHQPDLLVLDPSVYLLPINQLTYGPPQGSVPNHTFFRPICVVHVHGQHLVIPPEGMELEKMMLIQYYGHWATVQVFLSINIYVYIYKYIYTVTVYIYIHIDICFR